MQIPKEYSEKKRNIAKACFSPSYFQGILQLRNSSSESFQKARDYVFKRIEAENKKRKSPIFVSKEKKVRGGIDLYISSNKFLRKIIRELKADFGAETSESPKLFSKDRQTGKQIYRLNALARLPLFSEGDAVVIEQKGKSFLAVVCSIGQECYGADIETLKKKCFKHSDVRKIIKRKDMEDVVLLKLKPDPEFYSMSSFEHFEPANKLGKEQLRRLSLNKKLKCFSYNKKQYVI